MGHSAAVWDSRIAIERTKDWNGIDQIVLRNPHGASARVSLHGGQVTSWRNDRGEELLFTSSKAIFKPPKAIRGGIPICFPQFGDCGSPEQHGFARNKIWTIDDDPPPLPLNDSQGKSFVDLLLEPSEEDLKFWPHSFEFRLRVCLGSDGNLTLISRIRNINGKPFSFSFAYDSYLSVSDIRDCLRIKENKKKCAICGKKTSRLPASVTCYLHGLSVRQGRQKRIAVNTSSLLTESLHARVAIPPVETTRLRLRQVHYGTQSSCTKHEINGRMDRAQV